MKLKIIMVLIVVTIVSNSLAIEGNYPQKSLKITRNQANYLSPENTYHSIHSCTINQDIEWCDETMTVESLREHEKLFHEAGINREQVFELAKSIKESYITDKFIYKDTVVLVVEDHGFNGSINVLPLTFLEENGKWKLTNKYSSEDEVNTHIYYVPPLFDGKGQRPADVNSFLGYEQPTQAQTTLPVGTVSYTVHVYYGKTISPATFTAELNRQDIGHLFSPAPFTDEEIEIPLLKGRNVLALSIDGSRNDGRKGSDTDRLVFIVP